MIIYTIRPRDISGKFTPTNPRKGGPYTYFIFSKEHILMDGKLSNISKNAFLISYTEDHNLKERVWDFKKIDRAEIL